MEKTHIMKHNHESLIFHLKEAIRSCKEDATLSGVKQYLYAALSMTEKVANKRTKRESKSEYELFKELAKQRHEKWMKMLVDGAKMGMKNDETTND